MWIAGRQGSGYLKKLLWQSERFKFDVYILKFPKGSYVDWHNDPVVQGYKHFRCNVFLNYGLYKGGIFETIGNRIVSLGILEVFRPDITKHRVTLVTHGTRYVLSIGWLRRE